MEFKELRPKSPFEILLKPHNDERSFSIRTYDDNIFKIAGLEFNWIQENHSNMTIKIA